MRIGIFIPALIRDYDRIQSALWIRALQMVEPLRALGHNVSVNNPLRRYDAVIYHRGMMRRSYLFVRFLRTISRRVYWDTCVDYMVEHEGSGPEHVRWARRIAASVDGVICTTSGIAESVGRYNDRVMVMPDPVDLDHFSPPREETNLDAPLFGWSGVSVKAFSLNDHAAFLDGRCLIVSDARPELSFSYDFRRWSHATFPGDLRACDCAFLPRKVETTYTRNNSSFKALVYAVMGVPILADRLPSYEELARHYEGIVFLDEHDSPEAALAELRTRRLDPSAVREAYSCERWAGKLAAWLEDNR